MTLRKIGKSGRNDLTFHLYLMKRPLSISLSSSLLYGPEEEEALEDSLHACTERDE